MKLGNVFDRKFALWMLAVVSFLQSAKSTSLLANPLQNHQINKAISNVQLPDKIIGENNLVSVLKKQKTIPEKFESVVGAIGLLEMGCTATHIGNGIVLTAGHCFEAPDVQVSRETCGAKSKIAWTFLKDAAPERISKCEEILAMETSNLGDYAILKVSNPPESFLRLSSEKVSTRTKITIFSHPNTRPLEWSGECAVRSHRNLPGLPEDFFAHRCDTEPGSSGATVINFETLEVVGIHDGGTLESSNGAWNYATYASQLPADVLSLPISLPSSLPRL